MAARNPLVIIGGAVQELPAGDTVNGGSGTGVSPSKSPSFIYTAGLLTSVVYASDGSTKTLTWTAGILTRVDYLKNGVTTRKTFNYTDGVVSSISEVVIT